jgi:hypothetical protein
MPVLNQTPIREYIASGSGTVFVYDFKIVDEESLKVFIDEVLQTTGYTVSDVGSMGGGNVTFSVAPPADSVIRLERQTPLVRETDYIEGGALPAEVLDSDFDRIVQMVQELDAKTLQAFGGSGTDAHGRRITNVGTPIDPTDAVTKVWAETAGTSFVSQAAGHAAAAGVSETNAAASESAASDSEDAAAASAAAAALSEANAAASESAASTSESNAATSETNAAASEAAAAISETNAANSAWTASNAATGASSAQSAAIAAAEDAEESAIAAAASAADAENRVPKTSNTGSAVMPTGTSAQRDAIPGHGYTRFNTTLRTLETYDDVAMAWVPAGQGATGPVGNPVFYENDQSVTGDYTLPGNKNAMSTGPITIADGATVTISDGATWVIV